MVIPSYNGSFKFPTSTRSTGAKKVAGSFGRGNRHDARKYNFNKKNTSTTGQVCGDPNCGEMCSLDGVCYCCVLCT